MSVPHPVDPQRAGDVIAAEPVGDSNAAADAAREQVRLGLYVSAVRCLVTYLIAPALGATGAFAGFLGVAGLGLALLGSVISTYGAVRLWRLRHRARFLYGAVTFCVYLATALAAYELVLQAN
jgi:hypothetical protein